MRKDIPWATLILTLSWIAVSLFIWSTPSELQKNIVENYAYSTGNILEGKYWVFLTSIFIHGSLVHLFSNAIGFFFFGWAVENDLGPLKMLSIFILGAIFGDLFSSIVYPIDQLSIGASGGVSAVLATAVLVSPFKFAIMGGIVPAPILVVGVLYIMSNVAAFVVSPNDGISYAAHLGGASLGLAWGVSEVGKKRAIYLIVLGIILLLLISYLLKLLKLVF